MKVGAGELLDGETVWRKFLMPAADDAICIRVVLKRSDDRVLDWVSRSAALSRDEGGKCLICSEDMTPQEIRGSGWGPR